MLRASFFFLRLVAPFCVRAALALFHVRVPPVCPQVRCDRVAEGPLRGAPLPVAFCLTKRALAEARGGGGGNGRGGGGDGVGGGMDGTLSEDEARRGLGIDALKGGSGCFVTRPRDWG